MPESSAEMFDRVRLMARIDTDWDLSDNDTAALRHVLAAAEAREVGEKKPACIECDHPADGLIDVDGCGPLCRGCQKQRNAPTAAEVIEALRDALDDLLPSRGEGYFTDPERRGFAAIALCARWKEANGV